MSAYSVKWASNTMPRLAWIADPTDGGSGTRRDDTSTLPFGLISAWDLDGQWCTIRTTGRPRTTINERHSRVARSGEGPVLLRRADDAYRSLFSCALPIEDDGREGAALVRYGAVQCERGRRVSARSRFASSPAAALQDEQCDR